MKNKVSPPFRQAEFDILFGSGISREGALVDMGAQSGLVEKSGAWYLYKGEKLGQGRDNAKDYLRSNHKLADEIEDAIRAQYAASEKQAADKEAEKSLPMKPELAKPVPTKPELAKSASVKQGAVAAKGK